MNRNNSSKKSYLGYSIESLVLHRPKRKMRQKNVNAPSVRACFHLTAFYSG